jgi:murein DD-endopeptidase MepM/ murein hydrolase activator NlpD
VYVRAGDVIGLLGDTGVKGAAGRHLYFALSIRPSREFSETYWDPTPLMAKWPLHIPPHGTVAGFIPAGVSAHP